MELSFLIQIPLLFFSVILHEFSHGAAADYFGDDTARAMGRLTFDPLAHVDPVGTILLPALCLVTGSPLFGWAKPVPVATHRLSHKPFSLVLVSGIGPVSNILLACLAAAAIAAAARIAGAGSYQNLLFYVLNYAVLINLYLAIFNLIPVHPLDGSKVLGSLLPRNLSLAYERLAPYGFFIIVILMWTGLFGQIVSPVVYWLYNLLV
ncbi:MAG: site-2 protease family protein [Elusimicrobia bacterium]|nr:site-2 protease family protein [Elusimicrobiota bacterium]